jgi:lipoate synthase
MNEQKITAGLLRKLMSEISEECWCAGWLIGLMSHRHVESGPLVRSSYHAWSHVN